MEKTQTLTPILLFSYALETGYVKAPFHILFWPLQVSIQLYSVFFSGTFKGHWSNTTPNTSKFGKIKGAKKRTF